MQASRQKGDCICVAGPVTQEQYTCGQVITVPYQIHPASKSATAIHEKFHSRIEMIYEATEEARNGASTAVPSSTTSTPAAGAAVSGTVSSLGRLGRRQPSPWMNLGRKDRHLKSILLVFSADAREQRDLLVLSFFEMHGWTCQTNTGVGICFDEKRYHDVDCILFVQSSAVIESIGDPALPCDVDTVQRLRLSGFKMIVACLLNAAPSRRMEQKYRGVLDLLLDKPVIDAKMDALATACTRRRTELFLDM